MKVKIDKLGLSLFCPPALNRTNKTKQVACRHAKSVFLPGNLILAKKNVRIIYLENNLNLWL